MKRALSLACVALAAFGCGPAQLDEIVPVAASLQSLNVVQGAVLGGVGLGDAVMHLEDDNGGRFTVPVSVRAASAGALVDFSMRESAAGLQMRNAEVSTATDLFGTYDGAHYAVVLLIGYSGMFLENDAHVRLDVDALGFGLSLFAGHQWLTLAPAGDPVPLSE